MIAETGDASLRAAVDLSIAGLRAPNRKDHFQSLVLTLYQALAVAELRAPRTAQGAFIPVGNTFDAFAAVSKIFGSATTDVFIVDPYMDDSVLTDFAGTVPEGVSLRLLTDQATVKPSLAPAVLRWQVQFPTRPLDARLAGAKVLHDRAIFVDGTEAWTVTQSLKDLAKRSPAEIVRADDIATLKIAAYEAIWSGAVVVC
ncbi:phosphatidylserine/phosphatidylglycerophosphate/cardiolipin synthase family protein [Bradyrhizobium oligotrophicum]|uniref:phosphatidylserine/phosphatidylglycerophosphate/ cardiolipin synthase family protein n=1 Tax=Bradyrhizobium oligotrophicum TaxID=44255 RepID=UPI003EBD1AAE